MDSVYRQTESVIFNPSLAPSTVCEIITSNGKMSPKIEEMETASRYFEGHSDIERKSRCFFDKDGRKHENPAASNTKIKSNFLRMLVQQKQDYALSKSFVLKIQNESQDEISLADDEYGRAWKDFCDKSLFKTAYVLCGNAVNNGIAWGYLWIDEDGQLQIKDIQSELVYPIWHDRQHNSLEKLVYNFYQLKYSSSSPDKQEFAEYWTDTERHLFNVSNGYQEENNFIDDDGNPLFSHMTGNVSWGRIPFVAFKGTTDEKTLLSFIKEHIDTYEKLDSDSADSLVDGLDPILVFKGISPNVKDLIEARELAKVTRTISLDTDGDAHFIQSQPVISAYTEKMNSLRKDIFKFGYGVDIQEIRLGGNPNQLEIKSFYQDLDTYTDSLERNFQNFIDNLKYFFDKWWELTGRGAFDIAQSYKVLVKFDRSTLMNTSALIEDCVRLQSTGVSQRTLLELNPVVQDVELELSRLEDEKKKAESEENMFNFPAMREKTEENPDTEEKEVEE